MATSPPPPPDDRYQQDQRARQVERLRSIVASSREWWDHCARRCESDGVGQFDPSRLPKLYLDEFLREYDAACARRDGQYDPYRGDPYRGYGPPPQPQHYGQPPPHSAPPPGGYGGPPPGYPPPHYPPPAWHSYLPPLENHPYNSPRERSRDRRDKKNRKEEEEPKVAEHLPKLFYKTQMCQRYEQGMCNYGSECTYAHTDEELRKKPNMIKTALCKKFENTGYCGRGDRCDFAHGWHEIRAYKTTICKAHASKAGSCKSGSNCRFAHGEVELRERPDDLPSDALIAADAVMPFPKRPKRR
eukprot:TRINITY_DN18893_c0_g1_i2.p1 TRINITY_DN18893_c0_g1~~TRINITY_DN18893_c0_g1_i2.p1  ORF type:complete len:313 (-),score=31.28 TRINITY_DN18893_c0_g1_i2:64-966(-)